MMGMLARKLPLPLLPLLPLDALLVLVLKRFPTMGMLLGSSRLLVPPLLLAALPLPPRRPPTIGMLAMLRAPPLLLLLLLMPSPLRRSPTTGMLSRSRSTTMGRLSRRPCGAGAERTTVPAEKRVTDRINELNRFILSI